MSAFVQPEGAVVVDGLSKSDHNLRQERVYRIGSEVKIAK